MIGSDSVTIQNNEIRNATTVALLSLPHFVPSYVQVLSNNIHDSAAGLACHCNDCAFSGNTVNTGGNAIGIGGDRNVITSNVVVDGTVRAYGDDLLVSNNQISGPNVGPLLEVSGNYVAVTDNTLSGSTGYGMQAKTASGITSTSVTIARNTFSQVGSPIRTASGHCSLNWYDPRQGLSAPASPGRSACAPVLERLVIMTAIRPSLSPVRPAARF